MSTKSYFLHSKIARSSICLCNMAPYRVSHVCKRLTFLRDPICSLLWFIFLDFVQVGILVTLNGIYLHKFTCSSGQIGENLDRGNTNTFKMWFFFNSLNF